MLRFIIRRLLITIPTVLIIVTLTWGLIRLAPGSFYTGEKRIPPAIEKNISKDKTAARSILFTSLRQATVSRTTSSRVDMPSRIFCRPLPRRVIMPIWTAFWRSSKALPPERIISRSSSSISSTS